MLKKVLNGIKPSEQERKKLKEKTSLILKKIKAKDAKIVVGGSFAKDTWLTGNHDIDIFVQFDYDKYKNEDISLILEKGLGGLEFTKLHGSRDYFQIVKDGITFEIVPLLEIKKAEQAQNITDVSPLHALWVKKHGLGDEIRLTKAFGKAQNIYGAESYIKGFSGYVLEILTIHYGGFLKLIRGVSKWGEETILDPERLLKDPKKELNKSKILSPLILVDPVDKTRNAAAVLSKEKYNLFINACKRYLKKSSKSFFVKKKEKISKDAFVFELDVDIGKKDVVGGKLSSLFEKVKRQLRLEGFEILNSGFIFGEKAVFWFKFKEETLPRIRRVEGPAVTRVGNANDFVRKHKHAVSKGGILYAVEERRFFDAHHFISHLLEQEGMKFTFSR